MKTQFISINRGEGLEVRTHRYHLRTLFTYVQDKTIRRLPLSGSVCERSLHPYTERGGGCVGNRFGQVINGDEISGNCGRQ